MLAASAHADVDEPVQLSSRCAGVANMCAYLNDSMHSLLGKEVDTEALHWRQALIIADAQHFPFPAAEARRAGFIPTRIEPVISNTSRCHPNPNMSDPDARKAGYLMPPLMLWWA